MESSTAFSSEAAEAIFLPAIPRDVLGLGPAEYADWIQVQWPAIMRMDRLKHVRAGKYYFLAPGGKLL
jgi:hypothetical protein